MSKGEAEKRWFLGVSVKEVVFVVVLFGICRRSCEKLAIPVGSSSKMFGVGEKQQEEEEKTILLGFLTLGKTRERKKYI